MTFASVTECGLATDYERLRSHVLDGATAGGPFGLVILLREGVAAWMAHASVRPAKIMHEAANDRAAVEALIGDAAHAEMIAVLASMVMTTHQQRCA